MEKYQLEYRDVFSVTEGTDGDTRKTMEQSTSIVQQEEVLWFLFCMCLLLKFFRLIVTANSPEKAGLQPSSKGQISIYNSSLWHQPLGEPGHGSRSDQFLLPRGWPTSSHWFCVGYVGTDPAAFCLCSFSLHLLRLMSFYFATNAQCCSVPFLNNSFLFAKDYSTV